MADDDTPLYSRISDEMLFDPLPVYTGQIEYAGVTDWFTPAPLDRIDGWCEDRDQHAELTDLNGRE